MIRLWFTVLLALLVTMSGCILVPQEIMGDGNEAPNKRFEKMLSAGAIQIGKSQADDAARALIASYGIEQTYHTPRLYDDPAKRQMYVWYEEQNRAYGVTLNQHMFFIPMPMFGVKIDMPAAVRMNYDEDGVLRQWRRVTD